MSSGERWIDVKGVFLGYYRHTISFQESLFTGPVSVAALGGVFHLYGHVLPSLKNNALRVRPARIASAPAPIRCGTHAHQTPRLISSSEDNDLRIAALRIGLMTVHATHSRLTLS